MTPFKLKYDSWHVELCQRYLANSWDPSQITDLCTYIRKVLLAIFTVFCLGLIVCFCSLPLPVICAWLAAMINMNVWIEPSEATKIGLTLYCSVSGLIVLIVCYFFISDSTNDVWYDIKQKLAPSPDSFIGLAWTSFKTKTCVRVEFVE